MADLRTRPLYKDSLRLFAQLIQLSESSALSSIVSEDRDTSVIDPAIYIQDECGRFKVWAENVGAHRTGHLSLDYRLREATRVKQLVVELLKDLTTALQDGLLLYRRHRPCISDVISGQRRFRRASRFRHI